jgi:hypothetical protein
VLTAGAYMGETNLEFLVLIRYVQHPQRHVLSCQGGSRDERKFGHFDVYDVLIGICKEGAEAIGHSQYDWAMPYILSQWASEVLRELTVTIVASRLVVRRNESRDSTKSHGSEIRHARSPRH